MNDLSRMFSKSAMGHIYHKIILDKAGKPIDYMVLSANESAAKILGSTVKDMVNKSILQVVPNLKKDQFDWIGFYGDLALHQKEAEFDQYTEAMGKWFRVNAFSLEKYYFHTIFIDITPEILEKVHLQRVINASERFLEGDNTQIDFDMILCTMAEITGAKYGVLHLYSEDHKTFRAKAVYGVSEHITNAISVLGFNPFTRVWDWDQHRNDLIKDNIITRFEKLSDFSAEALSTKLVDSVSALLDLGETYVVQVQSNNLTLGDFVLIMEAGSRFENEEIAKLFARQVGLLLSRNRAENKLHRMVEIEATLSTISSSFVCIPFGKTREYIDKALAAAGELCKADKCMFYCPSLGEVSFAMEYLWGKDQVLDQDYEVFRLINRANRFWYTQYNQGLPIAFSDLAELPAEAVEEKNLLRKLGICSAIGIPILSVGGVNGMILFMRNNAGKAWTVEDHRVLKAIGEILAGASERMVNYRKLRESEEKYRLITENSSDVIWVYNLDRKSFTYVSPSISNLRGISVEEALREDIEDSVEPDFRDYVKSRMKDYLARYQIDKVFPPAKLIEVKQPRKDGSSVWVEISPTYRFNAENEIEVIGVSRNIDSRKALEAQLSKKTEEQLILLDNIATQVWYLVDPETYGAVNKTHADYNQLSKADMEYQNIRRFLPEEVTSYCIENNRYIFETGQPLFTEEWSPHPSGEHRLLSIHKIPKLDAKGRVEYVVCSAEDITMMHKAKEELVLAKDKAEESNRLKTAFLASMNHELRTPLNHIMGFAQILGGSEDPVEISECATHIYKSGEALLMMIQDIFDLALAEQEIIGPRLQKVRCFDHFFENKANLEDILEASGKKGNIELTFNPDLRALHADIEIDVSKVNQVLSNLFRNAVKFTSKGKIEFGFNLDPKGSIRYFVSDTGIGIPIAKQKVIFDFFRQADDSNTRVYGGVGIGLAISRKVTEIMGGELSLISKVDEGSSFVLEIPCKAQGDEDEEDKQIRIPNFSTYTILIAEDDLSSKMITRGIIGKTKAKILEAENGRVAVDMVQTQHVDAVVMDIRMPIMDGYQACKIIKRQYPDLPVLALTAHGVQNDNPEFKIHRFDAFLTKPINRDLIYLELSKYLR